MRSLGYSFETALADVIDNSVTAKAKTVSLWSPASPKETPYLAIIDDGAGMSGSKLLSSLQHACQNPNRERDPKDLGRFGLGMKTASLSQCRELTVVSKVDGEIHAGRWDLDVVAQRGDWALQILDESEINEVPCVFQLKEQDSGTLVLWRKFDRLQATESNIFEALRVALNRSIDHLSLVFHRFLSAKTTSDPVVHPLSIVLNGNPIEPKDPFLEHSSGMDSVKMPLEVIDMSGEKDDIFVRGYTLPRQNKIQTADLSRLGLKDRSLTDDQGFYIYRNGRLIFWGGWLRMQKKAQKLKLARILVDVPNSMDHLWHLDIMKSRAHPPKEVRVALQRILDNMLPADTSKNPCLVKGPARRFVEKINPIWVVNSSGEKYFNLSLNRESDIYKTLADEMDENLRRKFDAYLKMIERDFPAQWVFEQLANDRAPVQLQVPDKELKKDIKEQLRVILDLQHKSPEHASGLIESFMRNTPIFADNQKITNEVMQELQNEYRTNK